MLSNKARPNRYCHVQSKYLVILLILLGGCAVLLLGAEGEPDGADLDRAAGPQGPRDGAARFCVLPSVCDNGLINDDVNRKIMST